jgi:hypothetical protein
VLGTQETFCIVIAELFERDSFDLFLPEFDKPWVIHLRKTCCCSTNLCTWRPNTVYKNKRVRRHHGSSSEVNSPFSIKPTKGSTIEELDKIMENLDLEESSGSSTTAPTKNSAAPWKRTSSPAAAMYSEALRTHGGQD